MEKLKKHIAICNNANDNSELKNLYNYLHILGAKKIYWDTKSWNGEFMTRLSFYCLSEEFEKIKVYLKEKNFSINFK